MDDERPMQDTEEQQWQAERDEMSSDEAYWNWLAIVEQRLDEELGEDNG